MSHVRILAAILLPLVLSACGGGGGGGGGSQDNTQAAAQISGYATPPASPAEVTSLSIDSYAPATAASDVLIPPNTSAQAFATIMQGTTYSVTVSSSVETVDAAVVEAVDPATAIGIATGSAYTGDATLGQWSWIYSPFDPMSAFLGSPEFDTMDGLPSAYYGSTNISTGSVGYILPYSSTLSPNGYTYQTFGAVYGMTFSAAYGTSGSGSRGQVKEGYFSLGIPMAASALPTTGTSSYSGHFSGTYVKASTNELYDVSGEVTLTADFATRTISFATSNTTVLSANAASGTARTADSSLNLSGTLNYLVDSNTFTGTTSGNSLQGNATGRFYGPGTAATATKALGSPTEVGGTFALLAAGKGSIQGAFGAN